MAIVRKRITMYEGDSLPEHVIREVEEADKAPIVFDEECPELSDAQLDKMAAIVREREAEEARAKELNLQPLPLNVLPSTIRVAKKYGDAVMGRLLDLAVQDEKMIQKCL